MAEVLIMNGELAEAVALVAHGNAGLPGSDKAQLVGFEETNSTFQYVRSVTFETQSGRRRSSSVTSVASWLDYLRRGRFQKLSLMAGGVAPVAFADQGTWGILGHGRGEVEAWYPRWEVNRDGVDPAETKPRIWEVAYRSSARRGHVAVEPIDLLARSRELESAVGSAIEFAVTNDILTNFVPWFEQAQALQSSDNPVIEWHPDLLPPVGYSLQARRLLASATRSWVFGGMGSWNDIGFSEPALRDRYQTVSNDLYQAVIDSIRDATNSGQTN
jgi:hypothetical protein